MRRRRRNEIGKGQMLNNWCSDRKLLIEIIMYRNVIEIIKHLFTGFYSASINRIFQNIFSRTKPKNDENESADSYDDLSDSEDDEDSNAGLANRIPASHEVSMVHATRSILALASDPSGARLASGSIDSR